MGKLEFYKKCYEDCKKIIKAINDNPKISEEEKEKLTDEFLDRMNKFQSYINYLTLND